MDHPYLGQTRFNAFPFLTEMNVVACFFFFFWISQFTLAFRLKRGQHVVHLTKDAFYFNGGVWKQLPLWRDATHRAHRRHLFFSPPAKDKSGTVLI